MIPEVQAGGNLVWPSGVKGKPRWKKKSNRGGVQQLNSQELPGRELTVANIQRNQRVRRGGQGKNRAH